MIEKQEETHTKPLPLLINFKYGEKDKKIYRLAKIKLEDFSYNTIISLVKAYKPIKKNENILLLLCKTGLKEQLIIKNENEFESFKNSDYFWIYLDKSNIKLEFFFKKQMEIIENNNKNLDKIYHDLISDSNSKIILDCILNYVVQDKDLTEKLFTDLKDKNVINRDDINKEEFSKKLISNLFSNIKENYDTMLNTRSSFGNLKLNMSFTKIANVSNDDIEQNKDIKPFSELYNNNEIEDYSSQIVRDTLSSIQIIK